MKVGEERGEEAAAACVCAGGGSYGIGNVGAGLGLTALLSSNLTTRTDCDAHGPPTSSCPAQASLPALHAGLDDADDDVRAASADALVPLAPTLFSIGMPAVRKVRAQLWELLGKVRGGADGGEMRGGREVGGRVLA